MVEDIAYHDPAPGRVLLRTGASPFCSTDSSTGAASSGRSRRRSSGTPRWARWSRSGAGVDARQGRPAGDRPRHLGVRRLLLLLGRAAVAVLGDLRPRRDLAARRRPLERPAGERGRERRRLRRGDERDRHPGLPGRERPPRRVAQPARLRDHDRPRLRLQRRAGPGRDRASPSSGSGTSASGWSRRRRSRARGEIIAVDPIAERRELAGRLGATHLVDPSAEDPVEAVKTLTGGRGADYVLEAATLASGAGAGDDDVAARRHGRRHEHRDARTRR